MAVKESPSVENVRAALDDVRSGETDRRAAGTERLLGWAEPAIRRAMCGRPSSVEAEDAIQLARCAAFEVALDQRISPNAYFGAVKKSISYRLQMAAMDALPVTMHPDVYRGGKPVWNPSPATSAAIESARMSSISISDVAYDVDAKYYHLDDHDVDDDGQSKVRGQLADWLLSAIKDEKQLNIIRLIYGYTERGNLTEDEVADITGMDGSIVRRLHHLGLKAMRQAAQQAGQE